MPPESLLEPDIEDIDFEAPKKEDWTWAFRTPEKPDDFSEGAENAAALLTIQSDPERGLAVRSTEIIGVPKHLTIAGHEFELGAEPIGLGGFGVVYEAKLTPEQGRTRGREAKRDAELNRAIQEVAAEQGAVSASIVLKFIPEKSSGLASPAAIQKEAAAWSAHGGLVDLKRLKSDTGTVVSVLALEQAPGKDLFHLRLDRNWDPATHRSSFELMAAMRSYLKQLISLKERGWTSHNDIKPQNLMLARERGIARLIDLGLARRREEDERLREQGAKEVSGTFQYMSPLTLSGRLDPSADIRALGLSIAEVWGIMRGIAEDPGNIVEGRGIQSPALTESDYGSVLKFWYGKHVTFRSEREFGWLLYEMVLPHADARAYQETREQKPVSLESALARTNEILRDHIAFLTADAAIRALKQSPPAAGSPETSLLGEIEAALANEDRAALRELAARQEVKQLRRAYATRVRRAP